MARMLRIRGPQARIRRIDLSINLRPCLKLVRMELVEMIERNKLLSKDDWELTLEELEGQRLQTLLQLSVLEGSILTIEKKIQNFPVEIKGSKTNANP